MPESTVLAEPLPQPAPHIPNAPQENVVLPPLRQDLIVGRQIYEGRSFYVIKDPISLQYFRMTAEDYYLASLFDGRRTFGRIRDLFSEQFPHVRLEYSLEELNERVLRMSNDLALMQFLSVQGLRLKAKFDAQRKQKKNKGSFYNFVNQIFFARFSVFDPDRLFAKMTKPIGWIWTRTSLWISIAIVLAGIAVFCTNASRIHPTLQNFFSFHNLALIWVTTLVIKSIHELGHGLTCKHFGSEVHEVGVMMLVFTPYFFVNVSDSWVLPDRRHRMLISAAGIYVELVIAALATFLWAVVQPGPVQDFLFNIMVIASFSTLAFNANPLMRFDGYYIMTDLLEVPNLQGKSRALVTHQVKTLLFGRHSNDPVMARMPLPKKRFALFYTYAVLSWLYGYFVIYKLTWFMSDKLAKYDLRTLGRLLSFSALFAWVIMPLWTFSKGLQLKREDWKPHGRMRRFLLTCCALIGGFVIMCFVPVELKIRRSGAVELSEPEQVRPETPGFVREIYVKEGDAVMPAQPLALLENRDVESQFKSIGERLKAAENAVQRALGMDRPTELRQAQSQKLDYERRLEQARKDSEHLVLKAATRGTVLTHDLDKQIGKLLRSGELFCEIGSLDPMRIKMALNEKQVRYIAKGQNVEMKVDAYPGKTIRGKIAEVHPMLFAHDLPPALSARRSGDVPTAMDAHGQEVPVERTFEASIDVSNPERLLRPGMTGHGIIHAARRPWGRLVAQSILDLVSLDYRF